MLTVNQILDLNKQGFTAEQIEYLNSFHQPETGDSASFPPTPADQGTNTGDATPSASPADQGTNTGDATPSASPATSSTAPEDPTTGDAIKALSTQFAVLSETVKAMQTVNAQRAEQQPAQKVTADSIIKDFFGKKEGR